MNFTDALQSGQPFRKVGENNYYVFFEGKITAEHGVARGLSQEDLVQGEWEIQEKEFTFKLSELTALLQAYAADTKQDISVLISSAPRGIRA